eukprot:TRINITY_DN31672_c0_g1_i1.p1 TRINITY_DN31672_c0_g1~~TRINITY_DN31672_c0_g1_i1.p1  ORF type:complete len:115 (-),score=19.96 TRINITY_DN31672_c0_g1_i1:68-412(-)
MAGGWMVASFLGLLASEREEGGVITRDSDVIATFMGLVEPLKRDWCAPIRAVAMLVLEWGQGHDSSPECPGNASWSPQGVQDDDASQEGRPERMLPTLYTVSYTHLTLPTKRIV